jgi:hypothetical protein
MHSSKECADGFKIGKTVLASRVIDECQRIDGFITSYFYCKEGDPRKNSFLAVLKGLLSHMIRQFRSLMPYCIGKANGQRELSSTSTAKTLLEVFCGEISNQFVIIDGLDECDVNERTLLLSCLKEIVDHCDARDPGKLRLLIVSQDFGDIEDSLSASESEVTILRLTEADNRGEIESFVAQRVEQMAPHFKLDDAEKRYIRENTCLRANGMENTTHNGCYPVVRIGTVRNEPRPLTFVRDVLVRRTSHGKSLQTGPSRRPIKRAQRRHLSGWASSSVSDASLQRKVWNEADY